MKITLTNAWRQFVSKTLNIVWLFVAIVAASYLYYYVNSLNSNLNVILGIVSINNYLPLLFMCLLVNFILYRTSTFTMSLNPQQRFTLKITNWSITLTSILITLGLSIIVFGAVILKFYRVLDVHTWQIFLTLLLSTNILMYAFSKNLLGKLLTVISILPLWYLYSTPMGITFFVAISLIIFLVTFLTQEIFQFKITKKTNLLWMMNSKFVESIVYVLRYTKSLSAYVVYFALIIYLMLPKYLQIQYQIGPITLTMLISIITGFMVFYIALTAIFFKREKNLYINCYNPYIYVHFYVFNIIFISFLSTLSALFISKDFHNLANTFTTTNLSLGVFLIVSAIIRKKSTAVVFIAFIAAGFAQYATTNLIHNDYVGLILTIITFDVAIFIEYGIAKKNILDFKN